MGIRVEPVVAVRGAEEAHKALAARPVVKMLPQARRSPAATALITLEEGLVVPVAPMGAAPVEGALIVSLTPPGVERAVEQGTTVVVVVALLSIPMPVEGVADRPIPPAPVRAPLQEAAETPGTTRIRITPAAPDMAAPVERRGQTAPQAILDASSSPIRQPA